MADTEVWKSYLGKPTGWQWIVGCRECRWRRRTGWKGGYRVAVALALAHECERDTGTRADGTNLRALGVNPRALGTNPRAQRRTMGTS